MSDFDTTTFNAVFWSFFITSVIGLILKCGGLAYKSKCKEVNFCCMKFVRDTEMEEKEDELRIKQQSQNQKSGDESV
jgi:hypothetical protein